MIVELETTTSLLDPRYSPRVKGPPPPKPGYIPNPLSFLPTSTPLRSAGEDNEVFEAQRLESEILQRENEVKAMRRKDIAGKLTFEEFIKSSFTTGEKSQNANISKNNHNPSRNTTVLDKNTKQTIESVKNYQDKQLLISDKVNKKTATEAPGKSAHKSDSQTEHAAYLPSNLDYFDSVKSVYPVYPSDLVNSFLPGNDDLEDELGDDTLRPLPSLVTVLLDGCSSSPPYIVSVVRQARGLWPGVGIVVGVDEERLAEVSDVGHLSGVTFITVSNSLMCFVEPRTFLRA